MRRTSILNTTVPLSIKLPTGEEFAFSYRRYAWTESFNREINQKVRSQQKKLDELRKSLNEMKEDDLGRGSEVFFANLSFEEATASQNHWLLSKVVAKWELEDDKGATIPITEQAFAELPSEMVAAILTAITEDRNPDSAGNASAVAVEGSSGSTTDDGEK